MKTTFDLEIKPFTTSEPDINFQGATLKTEVTFDKGEYPEVIKSIPALINSIKDAILEIQTITK